MLKKCGKIPTDRALADSCFMLVAQTGHCRRHPVDQRHKKSKVGKLERHKTNDGLLEAALSRASSLAITYVTLSFVATRCPVSSDAIIITEGTSAPCGKPKKKKLSSPKIAKGSPGGIAPFTDYVLWWLCKCHLRDSNLRCCLF